MQAATVSKPKAKRNDVPVKIDSEVMRVARIVAAYKEIPLAELMSETLRPILQADLEEYQGRAAKKKPKSD